MAIYKIKDISPSLPESGSYFIAPSADIMGDIRIKAGVGIWYGAVLRGDNEPIIISNGSNIQDLCCLHTDPGYPVYIGENCTVGHSAIIHGCSIGNNCLIGMGATIMNGVEIGEYSIVGANCLIPEGKKFPERSLIVGSPGKKIRSVSEEEMKAITKSAKNYVRQWQIHSKAELIS